MKTKTKTNEKCGRATRSGRCAFPKGHPGRHLADGTRASLLALKRERCEHSFSTAEPACSRCGAPKAVRS